MIRFRLFYCLMAAFIIVGQGHAAKWRVNNNSFIDADFQTLQGANDSSYVSAGDTLYLEGASQTYGNIDITKPLVILGPGYLLAQNYQNTASTATARISDIDFEVGSEGSMIMGCVIDRLDFYTGNIMVKRNKLDYVYMYNEGLSDIHIIQNYIYSDHEYRCIYVQNNSTNVFIKNNFIRNTYSSYHRAIEMETNGSASIINNVIDGHLIIYNSVVQNNIMVDDTISGTGNTFDKNIGHAGYFPATNNLQNVDMSTVFDTTCTTCHSADGMWQIIDGSSATAYGVNGDDCGMYGGIAPYVISGLPNVPAVFYFNAATTGSASEGLSISIKAKTNK